MYEVKSKIFLNFSKTQKSALCNFLRALVKKEIEKDVDFIVQKFLDDEVYYLEINSSRFEFIREFIDDEKFISESRIFIKECKKYYDYKKKQEPLIQAQKAYDKKKRKFLQEVKMSKEEPTKKQLYYYEKLCKRYNIEITKFDDLSKLDLRNKIEEILDEHKTD